jgi:predicted phage tail protein
MNEPAIIGYGSGKSGSGGGINDTPDTLRSRAYARVVEIVSEGEIEGLVNGAKSIYLDKTPLQNADASYNFSGLAIAVRAGTQGQSYIPGFPDVENEIADGTEIFKSTPLVRTVTVATTDAIRVTLEFPSLYQTQSDGSITGTNCEYKIDIQSAGGGYVTAIDKVVTGKSTGKYQISHRIQLTGTAPWDIRVTRVSDDADSLNQNRLFLFSYTEIVEKKFTYPYSAIVALSVDSSQFSSIPTRAYDIKGIKVKVPSNYNPSTRAYTGVWDGTFTVAWTDNPAWCFYDLLTNPRYGLGNFIDATQIDKWSLYTIAQYCDQLVSNGFGGQEPRFTCNLYMQTRQEAFNWLQQIASIFRAMIYWGAGSLYASQDAPQDPVALYTQANVIGGEFTYQGASSKARHTIAVVTWNDPNNFYAQVPEYVEGDPDDIALYGEIETPIVAVGCTSRGQAHRLGKWLLYTEKVESEIVTFQAGFEGAIARPGQVIQIADSLKTAERRGGRLADVAGRTLMLDAPVALQIGQTYTVHVIASDGSLQSAAVLNPGGEVQSITTSSDLAVDPAPGAIWVLEGGGVTAQTWRVIAITEPSKGIYEITAVFHDPTKYSQIESFQLAPAATSTFNLPPPAPQNLTITATNFASGSSILVQITVSWDAISGMRGYRLTLTPPNGNAEIYDLATPSYDSPRLTNVDGTWSARVHAINLAGQPGPEIVASQAIASPVPNDITGFVKSVSGGTTTFTWNEAPEADVQYGGHIELRYSATGAGWNDHLTTVIASLSGTATTTTHATASGAFYIKAKNAAGRYSNTAAAV